MPPSYHLTSSQPAVPSNPAPHSSDSVYATHTLERRKGGGGGGRGGGGRSSGGKSSAKAGSGSGRASQSKLSSGRNVAGAASSKSKGGGKTFKLSKDSPFAGRKAGGGKRKEVFGTWQYGSGYPYGRTGSFVSGRSFPFVFWPVPIAPAYVGADEYAHHNGTERPGGNLTSVAFISNVPTTLETYRLVGDESSLESLLVSLNKSCGTSNTTAISPYNASVPLLDIPHPEQIVQWYRGSSLGLGLDGYNNTAALPANVPQDNSSAWATNVSTPLPAINTTFLGCINATVGMAIPLVAAAGKGGLNWWEILNIVVGCITAVVLLCAWGCC